VDSISTCFGGGGYFSIAFSLGVAEGLTDVGLPVAEHPMLGTSGGAWAAAALASSVPLGEIVEVTSRTSSGVSHREVVHEVLGERSDPRVSTVAIDRATGQRQVLRGDRVGVADAVGASSAAPGMFPPYRIGRRRYIDGGMYSPTAAHRAASAALLVLVVPMSGPILRGAGAVFSRLARNEARLWRWRTGGRVLHIEPNRAVAAAAGSGWRSLIDPETTEAVHREARVLGREVGARFAA
jgi:NTE family protein